jgi:peroxiredoxin
MHRLADLRGKVVMLVFWATWCPDCRKELPSVSALFETFRDRGLEVRLVSFREAAALVAKTVTERGYKPPVLLDASGDVTGRAYGVWGPPTAYFIDRQGQLVGRVVGVREWSSPQAHAFVRALLETR